MPRDDDNDPFQATPRLVEGLEAMKVVLVAAGVNHQVGLVVLYFIYYVIIFIIYP
jgi:hypothetical protein